MPPLEDIIAGAMLVAVTFYALLAGADFGGGVWDLFATGPRAQAQRDLISDAIAPIWEANHVWLILVITILFVAFPTAFATIMISLHIPLTLSLMGIVLRGAAFTFRHYDVHLDNVQRRWGRIFAITSTVTPITLGMCIGAIASGKITDDPAHASFFSAWLNPFAISVGFLSLALFSFIAAVFLAVEAKDVGLKEDFRKRALVSAGAIFILAWVSFFLAAEGAPRVRAGLTGSTWAMIYHSATGLAATAAIFCIWTRRYMIARLFATLQLVLIVWGWAISQYPYLVPETITISDAAAPPVTLKFLFWALAAGAALLFPSFYYLYRLFKGKAAFSIIGDDSPPTNPS